MPYIHQHQDVFQLTPVNVCAGWFKGNKEIVLLQQMHTTTVFQRQTLRMLLSILYYEGQMSTIEMEQILNWPLKHDDGVNVKKQ